MDDVTQKCVSRRTFLKGVTAGAVSMGLYTHGTLRAAAEVEAAQETQTPERANGDGQMKLYFFYSGWLNVPRGYFAQENEQANQTFIDCPMPFVLIEHKGKHVLFDIGNPENVIEGTYSEWNRMTMKMDISEWMPNALARLNLTTEDIDLILLSHLHPDHAGCLELFPHATVVLRRTEYELPDRYVTVPETIDWCLIEDSENYDVFGDGRVVLFFTPGHTAGHQSMMVRTQQHGVLVFAADACCLKANMDDNLLPVYCTPEAERKNYARFRAMEKAGMTILPGHDPQAWAAFPVAPAYIE